MEREALKLVLEALESMKETLSEHDEPTTFNEDQAIASIKEALAQPEPSFKEWTSDHVRDNLHKLKPPLPVQPEQEPVAWEQLHEHMAGPFYTPPPQREWVGLTEEETLGFTSQEMTVVKYVSKVLQEKNT